MNKIAFYIQNKRLAQIISKTYGINYDDSQKIVDIVFNETIKGIANIQKQEEGNNKSNE